MGLLERKSKFRRYRCQEAPSSSRGSPKEKITLEPGPVNKLFFLFTFGTLQLLLEEFKPMKNNSGKRQKGPKRRTKEPNVDPKALREVRSLISHSSGQLLTF